MSRGLAWFLEGIEFLNLTFGRMRSRICVSLRLGRLVKKKTRPVGRVFLESICNSLGFVCRGRIEKAIALFADLLQKLKLGFKEVDMAFLVLQ